MFLVVHQMVVSSNVQSEPSNVALEFRVEVSEGRSYFHTGGRGRQTLAEMTK